MNVFLSSFLRRLRKLLQYCRQYWPFKTRKKLLNRRLSTVEWEKLPSYLNRLFTACCLTIIQQFTTLHRNYKRFSPPFFSIQTPCIHLIPHHQPRYRWKRTTTIPITTTTETPNSSTNSPICPDLLPTGHRYRHLHLLAHPPSTRMCR